MHLQIMKFEKWLRKNISAKVREKELFWNKINMAFVSLNIKDGKRKHEIKYETLYIKQVILNWKKNLYRDRQTYDEIWKYIHNIWDKNFMTKNILLIAI